MRYATQDNNIPFPFLHLCINLFGYVPRTIRSPIDKFQYKNAFDKLKLILLRNYEIYYIVLNSFIKKFPTFYVIHIQLANTN